MIVHDTRAIARDAVAARPGRPATALVHDSPDARLVLFRIAPGEEVPSHTNASSVILTVLQGSGVFKGPDVEVAVQTGAIVTYDPNELHGMCATTEPLVVLATITPRPGTR